jgi:N-acetylmuramic acid 6-phosphate etherase
MLTESQNPASLNLDQMSALEIVTLMNSEDRRVLEAVEQALPQIAQAVDAIAERMRRGGRLIYIGAGTSGRLGVLDAVECVPTFSVPPTKVIGIIAGGEGAIIRSVEGAEDDRDGGKRDLFAATLTADDAVVGIAASGATPYVLGALEYAASLGALTVGVACNVPSPVVEQAQIGIGVAVGPEVLTGSTRLKSGTAQKMVLNMLSTGTMTKLGKVYGNLMVDVQVTNSKLVARARRIVAQLAQVSEEKASSLLDAANGSAKTAIVMAVRGVGVDEARRLLEAHSGDLRAVIG